MSCRTTPAGSAFTSWERIRHKDMLPDSVILGLFHELKRDYHRLSDEDKKYREESAEADYNKTLNRFASVLSYRQWDASRGGDGTLSPQQKESLLNRIDEAHKQPVPGADLIWALSRLEELAHRRTVAIDRFSQHIANRLKTSKDEIVEEFTKTLRNPESRNRRNITAQTINTANLFGLGTDAGIRTAVQLLTEQTEAVENARINEGGIPRIVRTSINSIKGKTGIKGLTVKEYGLDPRNSRLEILLHDTQANTDTIYYYHNIADHDNIVYAPDSDYDIGRLWAENIRGNSKYMYFSETERIVAGLAPRCNNCGQFANTQHSCPLTVEPRVINFSNTKSLWSRQTLSNNTDTKVELPPATEFRQAFSSGAVTVNDIAYGNWDKATGSITAYLDEELKLRIDSNRLHCTCETYKVREDCIHIRNVRMAVTERLAPAVQRLEGYTQSKREKYIATARERYIAEDAKKAREIFASDWTREEDTLKEAQKHWLSDQSVLYSENFNAFKTAYNEAKENRKANSGVPVIPYIRENALNGMATRKSKQGFGVELEFMLPDSLSEDEYSTRIDQIGRDFFAAGLTRTTEQVGYHSAKENGYKDTHTDENGLGTWSFESDSSVSGELVSPTMYDEPETWEKLEKAITILREHGAKVSRQVGSHVHVGTSFFKADPAKYTELARLMTQHEDVMFRLATDTGRGTHRLSRYTQPIDAVPPSGFSDITRGNPIRGRGALNYAHVKGKKEDHPEFRIFDGSLDPGTIQAQIKLAVAMTHAASRQASNGGTKRDKEPLGSHFNIMNTKGKPEKYTLENETATLRSLLDTLFNREEDKKQLVAVFANTKWSPGIESKEKVRRRSRIYY